MANQPVIPKHNRSAHGGVNTRINGRLLADTEFEELLNVDISTPGLRQKRKSPSTAATCADGGGGGGGDDDDGGGGVDLCPEITADDALENGVVGAAYLGTIAVSGGTAPYQSIVVTAGAMPAGLTAVANLAAGTVAVSGVPTTAGTAAFTVTATDADGCTGSRAYTVIIYALAANYAYTGTQNNYVGAGGCVGTPNAVVNHSYSLSQVGSTLVWSHTEVTTTWTLTWVSNGVWKLEVTGLPYGTHTINGTGTRPDDVTWPDGPCLGSGPFNEQFVDTTTVAA